MNEHVHPLVIVNPAANRGRCHEKWGRLAGALRDQNIAFDVAVTRHSTDAAELARNAALLGRKWIVVAGGDGTLNEVVNGVISLDQNIQLSVLPFGTGNDFARTLYRGWDGAGYQNTVTTLRWVKMFTRGKLRPVNVATVNGHYFINATGVGFDATVAKTVAEQAFYKRLGAMAYGLSALTTLTTFQPSDVKLTIDSSEIEIPDTWLVSVCNGQFYGGGMHICPGADVGDGLLDICIIRDISRSRLLTLLPTVYRAAHVKYPPYVQFYRGKRITVSFPNGMASHVDGEVLKETHLDIQVYEKSVDFVIPDEM